MCLWFLFCFLFIFYSSSPPPSFNPAPASSHPPQKNINPPSKQTVPQNETKSNETKLFGTSTDNGPIRALRLSPRRHVQQPQFHQHHGGLGPAAHRGSERDHNKVHCSVLGPRWRGHRHARLLGHSSRKPDVTSGKPGEMDGIQRDCHCSHGCRSRTGELAPAHTDRGGWYVCVSDKVQLQKPGLTHSP